MRHADDPDETEGRALYRAMADRLANDQINYARRAVAMLCSDCPPVGYPTDKTRCSDCPRREKRKEQADG